MILISSSLLWTVRLLIALSCLIRDYDYLIRLPHSHPVNHARETHINEIVTVASAVQTNVVNV